MRGRLLVLAPVVAVSLAGCGRTTTVESAAEIPANKRLDVAVTGLTADEALAGLFHLSRAAVSDLPVPAGQPVTVHLDRSALGVAGVGPQGLNPDGRHAGEYAVRGELQDAPPGWVAVLAEGRLVLIPLHQVLAIEVAPPGE